MKTRSLVAAGWLAFAACGLAAPGGTAGSAGVAGGGHAATASTSAGVASGSVNGGRAAATGGSLPSSGSAAAGVRSSLGSVGIGRSPGVVATARATSRVLPPELIMHNAWNDPVNSHVGASARPSNAQTDRLRVGNNLYPGAYGYVPVRPASGTSRYRQGGRGDGRGYCRYYYNSFPYPVYYPYLYGIDEYGGISGGGTVNSYAGLGTDDDLGAPDFSVPSNHYYGYVAPTQNSADSPNVALPEAPAVGPQDPATGARSGGDTPQGPDSLVEAVQDELSKRGYFAGKADAVYGAATKEAIRRFQSDQGLPATGRINEATLRALHLD